MAGGRWRSFREVVQRRKVFEPEQLERGNLRRCLNQWDLTALGVGSTLGVGVYVLVGWVALNIAGPSIVLSFLIAAVASMFAGLCYAEFGSRVPRAGSSYIYTYVTVGELMAFIIGWNNILESVFGTASVAKGLSMYVDSMVDRNMSAWFTSVAPINSVHMSTYFDFFAFAIVLALGVLLAVGVRESSMVNNVFATINMFVIIFIVFAGAFRADTSNWSIPAELVPAGAGSGGFFPFGVWGTLRGAAICFYGFVGFDSISASSEEVREPRRSIPYAILTVLCIVFLAYACVATVVTMMVPYYLQDTAAAVAMAFSAVGWEWARWIVSVGAIFGILASLFGAMFPLPRLLYAMSSDGLLFHWFAKVSLSRKSPAIATLLPAAVIAILSGILVLEQLVMMMCIGTLLSYTIVAACVILLRYRSDYVPEASAGYVKQMFGLGDKTPTRATATIIHIALILFMCTCIAMALVGIHMENPIIVSSILHVLALMLLVVMTLQPKTKEDLPFKTPLVPIIPCLSIYANIHLMILINVQTWIRVLIWIVIGIPIYILCLFCYKRKKGNNLENNVTSFSHANKNGKTPMQIIVEPPTPPSTIREISNHGGDNPPTDDINAARVQEKAVRNEPYIIEDIIVQQAVIENNEEKEAKIIDLLDQVLQAEEDTYGEIISLKENKDDVTSTMHETAVHRKSLSELSDAGSDASLGNQVLSKYDVIAQVHREDLPRVTEEEEKIDKENIDDDDEEVTAFNESETASRTDESGYSDTIDKTTLNESPDDSKEGVNIPVPPPLPPLDDNNFASPTFKKSYTISARPNRPKSAPTEETEIEKPRESVQSNSSQEDGNIIFGSNRQANFMSKLNNIFQTMINTNDGEESRKRSHSTGNVVEGTPLALNRERPQMFLDLKKEIMSREASQNLRPVNIDDKNSDAEEEEEEASLSREDLKSKLETIFAAGGPQLLKPRLMKSNPPTPESDFQSDVSSKESLPELPKLEKNDTLKRQKAKFSDVLNSFRLSMNKDDNV